jgi:hypothetical protein
MTKLTVDRFVEQAMLESELEEFPHLHVRIHGLHLVIYSLEEGEVVNRARLTKVTIQYYMLSMANSHGKWEPTPYRGTFDEIVTLLTEQFSFVLAPWPS